VHDAAAREYCHNKKLNNAPSHLLVQITGKCGARRIAEPVVAAFISGIRGP